MCNKIYSLKDDLIQIFNSAFGQWHWLGCQPSTGFWNRSPDTGVLSQNIFMESWLEGKCVVGKGRQATRIIARGLSNKLSLSIKVHHTDISRKWVMGYFQFHLEIKVPEPGRRVEWRRIRVAWSLEWNFHSQWWFEVPRRLLPLLHCVASTPQSTQITSCSHPLTSFMEMLISFSGRTLHLPAVSKLP